MGLVIVRARVDGGRSQKGVRREHFFFFSNSFFFVHNFSAACGIYGMPEARCGIQPRGQNWMAEELRKLHKEKGRLSLPL